MPKYNIFISYRRNGGFETAKHLFDLLVRDGYSVSFDIDTLREGDFDKALFKRIDECEDFIIIIDAHCFERTLDPNFAPEKDWLRQELRYALELEKNVIPVLLSGASFPDNLPKDIERVRFKNEAKYSVDYFDSFYERLKSYFHSEAENSDALPMNRRIASSIEGAEIHIETDTDCFIYRFNEKITEAKFDEDTTIYLNKGKHRITLVSKSFPSISEQIILDIPSNNYSDIISVRLRLRELEQTPLFCVQKNNRYGYIDKEGHVVIPLEYDGVKFDFWEGLAAIKKDTKWGFINKMGTIVIPFVYDNVRDFCEGLACVKKGEKWGFIDKVGSVIVPFEYDKAWEYHEGLACVMKGKKWGFIDRTGRVVIPLDYAEVTGGYDEDLAYVKKGERWGFINKAGTVVIPFEYDEVSNFSEELACVKKGERWGCINKKGAIIIPFEYDLMSDFSEGLAFVEKDKKIGFIDRSGHVVIPFEYENANMFHNGLANVKDGKWGQIDKTGQVVIPFEYDFVGQFCEGLACVKKGEKWGFINKMGTIVIPFVYDDVFNFCEGLACVKKGEKWGFIDKAGSVIVPFEYDRPVPDFDFD